MRGYSLAALCALLGLGPAYGQDAQCVFPDPSVACACTALVGDAAAPIGSLSGLSGDVQITSQVQFSPVGDANPVFIGDSIVVPADGTATLAFGASCTAVLTPNTSLVVRAADGCACASTVELEEAGGFGNLAGVVGATLLIGGGAALVAVSGSDDGPASP